MHINAYGRCPAVFRVYAPAGMALLKLPINEMSSFDLPPVCLITGERNDVTFRRVRFSWYPRWVPVLILVPTGGLLLALIVALILAKRAAGELPFSDEGWSRWRRAKLMVPVAVLWVIVAMLGGVFFLSSEQTALGLLALLTMVGVPLVLYLTVQRGRMVTPASITDTEIALNVPSLQAALAIREHLHSGRVVQAMPVAADGL